MGRSILLINSGNSDTQAFLPQDGNYPPLGIVSIGTTLLHEQPDVHVRVMDGQVQSPHAILSYIQSKRPDVVGISLYGTSYSNSIRFARAAKEVGAITIFGNDQAKTQAEMLLKNNDADYVMTADVGEFAFVRFIDFLDGKIPIQDVPKLAYLRNNSLVVNSGNEFPSDCAHYKTIMDCIPIPNRKLLDSECWEAYRTNYLRSYKRLHPNGIRGITTINRARGCSRYRNECLFCGIMDLSMRFSSPEVFWKDVQAGVDQVDAEIFYEVFDSMGSAPLWVKEIANHKPKQLDYVKFFVYTQAIETTPALIESYQKMGVYRVNMGMESGDDTMLKRLKGPRDSVEQNKRAALLLRDAGITLHASLILGAPGETQESISNTIRFARWLVDNNCVSSIEASPLYPEFNSRAGKMLITPSFTGEMAQKQGFRIPDSGKLLQMQQKYSTQSNPHPDEISRDWARIFCDASYDEILSASHAISDYALAHGLATGAAFRSADPKDPFHA